jgi:aryl-alcohol dehydrogenase
LIVKAAVVRHPQRPLAIEDIVLDEPRADEILVRLIASGVGWSDLEAIDGGLPVPFPFVAGGEGAGIVEGIGGNVEGIAAGDTVILTTAFCGVCPKCREGSPALCVEYEALNWRGTRADGSAPLSGDDQPIHGFFQGQSSFATHALCRTASVVKVPTEAPLEVLACLGGELCAAASAVIHAASAGLDAIVIIGAGGPGLVAVMTARALEIRTIILVDPDETRRGLATELGATFTVHADTDLSAVVMSVTSGGVALAMETTGDPTSLDACMASLAPGGTCALLRSPGFVSPSADALSADDRHVIEISRGCGSPHKTVETLVAWHAAGDFPLEKLVVFYPFEHINDALQSLAAKAVPKPIVRFSLGSFGDLDRAGAEGAAVDEPTDEPVDDTDPVSDNVEAAKV